MRIASVCPSNTELICALGLESELIAVDNYSDYPLEVVHALPRLGPDLHIDIERLTALAPDLVVSSLSVPGMEKVVAQIEQAGLRQLTLSSESLQGIRSDLLRISEAVGKSSVSRRAAQLCDDMQTRIERITQASQAIQNMPAVYWEWWPNPIFSPAADNWLTELSHLAGANNIFGGMPGSQVQDDGSRLLALQPDYIFIVWTGIPQARVPLNKILKRPEIAQSPAVAGEHLYILSEGLYCRPSLRLLDGPEQLFGLLYPDRCSELGLEQPSAYGPVRDIKGRWL